MLLFQATPMASFLDVEIFISSLDKLFTFSITALLIAHFYPNSSFLEVTFLHQVFVFNVDHVREGKGIY